MANETNPPKDKGKGPVQPVDLQDLRAQAHAETEDEAEGGSFLSMCQAELSHQQVQQPSGSNLQAPPRDRGMESHTVEAGELQEEDDPRPERFGKSAASVNWLERKLDRSQRLLSQRINAIDTGLTSVTQAIRDMQTMQQDMHSQLLDRFDRQGDDIRLLRENQVYLADVIDKDNQHHHDQFARLQAQLNEHLPAKEGRRITFDFTDIQTQALRRNARASLNPTSRPSVPPESPLDLEHSPPMPCRSQLDPGEGSSRNPPAAVPREEVPSGPETFVLERFPRASGPAMASPEPLQHGLRPSVNPGIMVQSPRPHQGPASSVDHSVHGQSIRPQQIPSTTAEEANRRYFQMAYGPGLFQQQPQQPQHQPPQHQQCGQQMPPAAFPTLGQQQQVPKVSQYEHQQANLHHFNQPVHPEQWLARNSATPTFAAHQVPAFNPMLHIQQQQQAGPEAFGGSGSSAFKLKREDVGVFEPFHPDPGDLGCVTKGKNVIFTDSYAFETRLMSFLLDPDTAAANEKQLKELFPTLLTGAALIWWNTEVSPYVQSHMFRSGLASTINAVKQRFAPNRIEASARFNQGRLTLKDIAANENALSQYITKKMRYARIIGMTAENGQNWFGAMMQIWTSLGNDIKPYLRAPNIMELMGDYMAEVEVARPTLFAIAQQRYPYVKPSGNELDSDSDDEGVKKKRHRDKDRDGKKSKKHRDRDYSAAQVKSFEKKDRKDFKKDTKLK